MRKQMQRVTPRTKIYLSKSVFDVMHLAQSRLLSDYTRLCFVAECAELLTTSVNVEAVYDK